MSFEALYLLLTIEDGKETYKIISSNQKDASVITFSLELRWSMPKGKEREKQQYASDID
jgi:hypothetical protein